MNEGFEAYLDKIKKYINYAESDTFRWKDVVGLLIIQLKNTDSLNKNTKESHATQIQLTAEKDAPDGQSKTEDFFPTLTLNSSFKSWRISIPVRINNKNVIDLGGESCSETEWKNDSIQMRRRLLNVDENGKGNPTLQICYGEDLMPLRQVLAVDDYLVVVKRKGTSVYEAFGIPHSIELGNGKKMYLSETASGDSTMFDFKDIVVSEIDDEELERREKAFIEWMRQEAINKGEEFNETSKKGYAYALRKAAEKINGFMYESTNLFFYYEVAKIKEIDAFIRQADNFATVNHSYGNGQLSAGLIKYIEFLTEIENAMEESKAASKKTCLDMARTPRKNKLFPLNFIVYGAPGTGKTYSMVEYALAIIDNMPIDAFRAANTDRKANVTRYKSLVKAGQVVFTTFHQNYGYEEFIQGLRPDKDSDTMAFKTVDGVFKVIADTALNDTEGKNYVIVIDEINRANISKVFGELITLIEEDKRWGELNETSATLQSGDPFAVPNNLYIVGTMNSADKSISLIDAALRRRFDFIEQKPDASLVADPVLKTVLETINLSLVEELDSTDLLVGHSYFMNKTQSDLCNILNNNIIPLLYEYFYDNRKKVATILKIATDKAGAKIDIIDEKVGRLRVKNTD